MPNGTIEEIPITAYVYREDDSLNWWWVEVSTPDARVREAYTSRRLALRRLVQIVSDYQNNEVKDE